jgi:hypothetical protein
MLQREELGLVSGDVIFGWPLKISPDIDTGGYFFRFLDLSRRDAILLCLYLIQKHLVIRQQVFTLSHDMR